jgi:GxxExxY protein
MENHYFGTEKESMGRELNKDLVFAEECYQIIGAAMEVHNELGPGFLEPVYQEALLHEMRMRNISAKPEEPLHIHYKEIELSKKYRADFICYDAIIVELKALSELLPVHTAQTLNYLKATGFKVALLINFGASKLEYKRLIL